MDASEYWGGGGSHSHMPSSSSRVQVMPAHGQEDEEIYLSNNITNTQVVLMDGQDALTLEQQADMMRANKGGCRSSKVGGWVCLQVVVVVDCDFNRLYGCIADKFKCLYLLVETAIAMRRRQKDHVDGVDQEMYVVSTE